MTRREVSVGAVFAVVLVTILGGTPSQEPAPALPERCRDGEVVVSKGFGKFACAELRELLGTSRCSRGDVLTADAFGQFACRSTSDLVRDANPLPSCSSGDVLVSEGFGRWGCGSR